MPDSSNTPGTGVVARLLASSVAHGRPDLREERPRLQVRCVCNVLVMPSLLD